MIDTVRADEMNYAAYEEADTYINANLNNGAVYVLGESGVVKEV